MFQAAVFYAHKYKIDILCIRDTQANIKKSSHKLIWNTIVRLGLKDDFELTQYEIRCVKTGSTFNFKGVNRDPEGVKSWEGFDIAIVEEASQISQEALENLIPTIRNEGSEIWFLFNPRLPTDPVAKMFLQGQLPPKTLIEKVNYTDNRYCPKKIIDQAEHMRNTDPELYEYIWQGGYATALNDQWISMTAVAKSQTCKFTRDEKMPIMAGLDVARMGDDFSALVIRRGDEILHMRKWAKTKSDKLSREVLSECQKFNVSKVVVDGGGLGGPFVDFMARDAKNLPIQVIEYNSSFSPDDSKYKNARMEVWARMKEWILEGGALPSDIELEGQLTTIRYFFNTTNKLQLESKEDMKKRGVKSPDLADALAMTFYVPQTDSNEIANNFYGSSSDDYDEWG